MKNTTSIPGLPHYETPRTRREFLARAGAGFGALAATHLLNNSSFGDAQSIANLKSKIANPLDPLAAKLPHYAPTAKSVIFLFMEGGPSHIDLFDPKPALEKYAGKPVPPSFGEVVLAMGEYGSPIMASPRKWKQCGHAGTWMSDWIPWHHQIADDIAVLRGCVSDGINHSGGVCQMNTGSVLAGRP